VLSVVESQKQTVDVIGLLSVKEAAQYLCSHPMTVRKLAWKGILPHVRIGRRMFFEISDLKEFTQNNKIPIDMIKKTSYHKSQRETAWGRRIDA
jgi:excisionase family DNA binding protein